MLGKSLLCIALSCASLLAQSTAKLDSDLAALSNPSASIAVIAGRFADDMLTLADNDARPSRRTALDFSVELGKALTGKPTTEAKLRTVNAAILEVLGSSAMTSARFHSSIDRFRDALLALNVEPDAAKSAANRLMILGQEVRGPEDSPSKWPQRQKIQ